MRLGILQGYGAGAAPAELAAGLLRIAREYLKLGAGGSSPALAAVKTALALLPTGHSIAAYAFLLASQAEALLLPVGDALETPFALIAQVASYKRVIINFYFALFAGTIDCASALGS